MNPFVATYRDTKTLLGRLAGLKPFILYELLRVRLEYVYGTLTATRLFRNTCSDR
jgi:hypothetical protein